MRDLYAARQGGARLPIVALGIMIGAGCAAGAGHPEQIDPGESFRLRMGETAAVGGDSVVVGFESVVSDSRCAKSVVCVWEGEAIVRVWLQQADSARVTHELHTGSRGPAAASFGDYAIRLVALAPAAIAERQIAPSDYVATLSVSIGPAVDDALDRESGVQ